MKTRVLLVEFDYQQGDGGHFSELVAVASPAEEAHLQKMLDDGEEAGVIMGAYIGPQQKPPTPYKTFVTTLVDAIFAEHLPRDPS